MGYRYCYCFYTYLVGEGIDMNDTLMYMLALCLVWPVGWIANKILEG